jgi:N-glycosylase/DNA lyase
LFILPQFYFVVAIRSWREDMTEENLIKKILALKSSNVREIVDERTRKFKALGKKGDKDWFFELCFCILTAASTAKLGIKIQNELGADGFLTLSYQKLVSKLKKAGHMYWDQRAERIVKARKFYNIKEIVTSFPDERSARDWLAENVDGIGYKEASHFLRNVGYSDVAILDRHILTMMKQYGLLEGTPKTLTKKKYLVAEEKLRELAQKTNLSLAELDLYLWYMETGVVLK